MYRYTTPDELEDVIARRRVIEELEEEDEIEAEKAKQEYEEQLEAEEQEKITNKEKGE